MAEHYGTLAEALTYHADRGNAAWATSTDELRTAALVRASQALDALYGNRFPGTIATAVQELLWPRTEVTYRGEPVPEDEVPPPVARAAYELALRELIRPNSILPDVVPGKVKQRVRVEGAVEVEYAAGSAADQRPNIAVVDGILGNLLLPAPGRVSVTSLVRF